MLTGITVQKVFTKDMTLDQIYYFIWKTQLEQNPMTAATNQTTDNFIAHGHCYSVFGIDKTSNKIILKNPWGGNFGADKHKAIILLAIKTFKKNFDCIAKSWF